MTPSLQGIKKRTDYLRLSGSPIKWTTPCFLVQLISSPLTSDSVRYGLTASRRLGIAVERNRAKRRLRELMRRHLVELGLPGYDYGFVARKAVLTAPFEALEKDLKWALGHVHRQLRQQNDKEGFSGDADPS